MRLFTWLRPKKQRPHKSGPTRRPLYDLVEETNEQVAALADLVHDLATRPYPGSVVEEEEEEPAGEGWEPFVAYSPMIDALGQEMRERDGEEENYAEYAYAAEIAAIIDDGFDETDD